jgi:hypothetical protein
VLAGLGSGHVDDLAREAVDEDEATLADGRSLSREEQSGTGELQQQKIRTNAKQCNKDSCAEMLTQRWPETDPCQSRSWRQPRPPLMKSKRTIARLAMRLSKLKQNKND